MSSVFCKRSLCLPVVFIVNAMTFSFSLLYDAFLYESEMQIFAWGAKYLVRGGKSFAMFAYDSSADCTQGHSLGPSLEGPGTESNPQIRFYASCYEDYMVLITRQTTLWKFVKTVWKLVIKRCGIAITQRLFLTTF